MGIRSQNNPIAAYLDVFSNTGTDAAAAGGGGPNIGAPQGLTATGGIISDYVSTPGDVYRTHVFTSSGTFAVSALSGSFPAAVEYLVVAGGGGGGVGGDYSSYQAGGGGGGAGGLLVSPGFPGVPTSQNQGTAMTVSAGPTTYTITIGAGGLNGVAAPTVGTSKGGKQGADSVISGPDVTTITAKGGGGGSGNSQTAQGGIGYGSGGGGEGAYSPGPFANLAAGGSYPGTIQQGFPGGHGSTNGGSYPSPGYRFGGGGGGAGAAGISGADPNPGSTEGDGGLGLQVLIAGNAPAAAIGTPGPSGTGWVAQGGHGGAYNNGSNASLPQPAGGGGGAGGGHSTGGTNGLSGTGGGGGGANAPGPGSGVAGAGGSGIVVVRYQIGKVTALAKATGGAISFYNNKTIHAFTNTGDFNNTSGANLTGCEVVILGGGGGGNVWQGGGGGSGRFYRNDDVTISPGPNTVTIGAGGAGGGGGPAPGLPVAPSGSQSVFNSVTMPGGGGGGLYDVPAAVGGSGGGGSYAASSPGAASPGNVVAVTNTDTPSDGAGNAGGAGASPQGAGGGGGAGAVGASSPGSDKKGASGGAGVQLPSTFRDPLSTVGFPGPSSALHFVGGGGGGSAGSPSPVDAGGGGGAPQVPSTYQGTSMTTAQQPNYEWAGAGSGVQDTGPSATSARANSGSGGGGTGSGAGNVSIRGGSGGSGIVLIAYPS